MVMEEYVGCIVAMVNRSRTIDIWQDKITLISSRSGLNESVLRPYRKVKYIQYAIRSILFILSFLAFFSL